MSQPKDWEKEWYELQKKSRKLAKRANQRLVRLERAAKRPGMQNILKYAYRSAMKDINTTGKKGKQRFIENPKLIDVEKDGKKVEEKSQEYYRINVMRLRIRTKDIENFLGAASSTIGQGIAEGLNKTIGIKRLWNKRNKTINNKFLSDYDLRMSDNDMKRFFESKKQAKLEAEVGSDKMFIVAAVMKKYNIKTNKRDLEKFFRSHIDLDKYNLSEDDIKSKKGESYKQYHERLKDFVKYTDDDVINDMVNKVIQKGIGSNNLFI